jgi:8-oxo-dGTP pyrophosphatase MutT (NUDIX family)
MILKRRLAGWLQRFPPLRWLLAVAVRLIVPRHYVGAVGAIFNDAGQVLLMEHVFRAEFPWGLPGGWVERGESPADAVRREVEEELGLSIEIKQLLVCEVQGGGFKDTTPRGLGLVYYCRLPGDPLLIFNKLVEAEQHPEILSVKWVDPAAIEYKLTPLEAKGVALARQAFKEERAEEIEDRS